MHKSFFICLFLFAYISASAQNEKIYYDEHWRQVKKKRKADWYRLYIPEDSIYKIEDHYIEGPLYSTGYRTSLPSNSCSHRVGPIVFYDRQRHKTRQGQYSKGIRTGVWKYYYEGSDALKAEYYYTDDTERHAQVLRYDSLSHRLKSKTIMGLY